jgi:3',5'-cyclic AMP phosphodiesterase CpdA
VTERPEQLLDAGAEPWPLVIAHVSDFHLGAHLPARVAALVSDVAAAAPTLTVVTGDLTMRARPRQLVQARALLDQLPSPHLVILGNHDVPLGPARRLLRPYARYQAHIEAELDPWLQLPGLRALALASMPRWRWKGGRVSQRQADVVVEVLGAAPPASARLLALHHPPLLRGPARIVGRRSLVRSLISARVDLVLAGHIHVPRARAVELAADGRTHRVVEVVAGTATSARTRRGVGRSWSLIRVDASSIAVEERHEAGSCWRSGRMVTYARAAG